MLKPFSRAVEKRIGRHINDLRYLNRGNEGTDPNIDRTDWRDRSGLKEHNTGPQG